MPHTHINPAEAFEADDQGYRGQPFPQPPRGMLRQRSFFSDSSSDFGGADPAQVLRMDGFDAPQPPTLGSRLRESGISAAEAAIAGIGLGARQYAEGATIRGLGRGEQWLDRTLRIPRTRESLVPPPDEVAPPQIIGRPSEVEPLLERAGQRAALQEARAIQDIEAFTQGQMAEAEAEGLASAAEAAASGAEAAAAAEAGVAGTGILATAGEAALGVAGAAGAAAGGLAVAGAAAALVGTAWAIEGGLNAASHLMGFAGGAGGGTDSDQSRSSGAVDIQTLNGMQESGVQQHFAMHQQRQRPEVIRIDSDSDSAPRAQPAPRVRARAARQQPSPFGVNPPCRGRRASPAAARAPGSAGRAAATAGPWEPNRRSTSSGVTSNSPDLIGERQARWRT